MRPGLLTRIGRILRRHWLFSILFTLGIAIRVITWLAYQPSLLYIDSYRYLRYMNPWHINGINPIGYDVLIWPVLYGGRHFGIGLALTAAVQHLLGLGVALVCYLLARGLGAARIVAAVITAPMLFDAYELQIEQNLMAEAWSDALLIAAVWLLLAWRLNLGGRPRPLPGRFGPRAWQAAAAGALIGANVPVRVIGIVVVIPFAAYLIFAGARWRDRAWWKQMITRLVAGGAGFAILIGGYAGVYRAIVGQWALSGADSKVLYARAATVAECGSLKLSKDVAQLCPKAPRDQRPGVDRYAHGKYHADFVPPGQTQTELMHKFGVEVLKQQPADFVVAAAKDFAKGFSWTRTQSPNDVPLSRWQFQLHYPRWKNLHAKLVTQKFDHRNPKVVQPLARFLRHYQLNGGYTRGTLLGIAGLIGIAGIFRRRGGLRAEALLTVGIGLVLVAGAAGFEFSWRYQLPGLVFFPLSAAIGFTALITRRKPDQADQPDQADRPDQAGQPDHPDQREPVEVGGYRGVDADHGRPDS